MKEVLLNSIETGTNNGTKEGISLGQCLNEHTKEELLDNGNEVYCSNCKDHKATRKKVKFSLPYLPKVLILSLKRFEFRDLRNVTGGYDVVTHREKIETFVDFPIDNFDLAPFCQQLNDGIDSSNPSADDPQIKYSTMYDLFAVCNHYGRLGFGHYTASTRDVDGVDGKPISEWYSFDDNEVKGPLRTSLDYDEEVHSKNAYILFYHRRE
jgi:ubiquitin C-terminal hydrolase